ncbi:MAG TPA: helix-turn-helix domain-containing protein [Terriglobales bacterium]|nr:helix-turn-helix domain-containing protein [Terriglobales bacterium]HXF12836.1 helix-turn-helix domain-containing protein [Terriglobales bacterium]
MGVHFKPGGAFPFLRPPADELRDTHIDLEAIWGRAVAEIRNRLCETISLARRFRLLERFLLSRVYRPMQHHGAVVMALANLASARSQMTRELASEACLSEKRFIDVFRSEVGLNPRLINRICRFQRVLALIHRTAAPDWAQLALNHGYYDQSHLIRDFAAFSGFGPADYIRRLSDLRKRGLGAKFNHLPGT